MCSFSGRVTRGLRPVSSNIAAEISIHTFLIYFGDSDFASLRMAACHCSSVVVYTSATIMLLEALLAVGFIRINR